MSNQHKKQQLALQGGMKAVSTIEGKGQPKIGIEEFLSVADRFGIPSPTLKKIKKLLDQDKWGEGPFLANYYSNLKVTKVEAYEQAARQAFGSKYAIATSSGTGALHAAFVAVGVGPGTEVILPAIGFFATAAAVVAAKGVPVFCDVDQSLSIDPKKIAAAITPRTVAISPTHVMGSVCDMKAIMKVARKHKLKVVEDCAQSCGGMYDGKRIGTYGDIGCFSISSYKTVGGGEGGLLLTGNKKLWDKASCVVEGGGLWRKVRFAKPTYPGELFCGLNYRMSELEAAVDVVQIKKMDATANRFRKVKQRILKQLDTFAEIDPQTLNDSQGEVGYLLRFFPRDLKLGQKIVKALQAEGIDAGTRGKSTAPDWHIYSYMYPVTLQYGSPDNHCPFDCPRYTKAGGKVNYKRGDCPVADDLFDSMISIPLNQWYSAADCRNIAKGINKVLSAYCTQDKKAKLWV